MQELIRLLIVRSFGVNFIIIPKFGDIVYGLLHRAYMTLVHMLIAQFVENLTKFMLSIIL
jgi:hypothetical protein